VQWDPYNVPILSEKAGKVKFHDIIEGVTMKQETDETTRSGGHGAGGAQGKTCARKIIISDDSGEVVANYPIPSGAHVVVAEGSKIVAGTLMAKTPRKDFPRPRTLPPVCPGVAELLFEARRPKDASENFQRLDVWWTLGQACAGKTLRCHQRPRRPRWRRNTLIPHRKHVIVFKGDMVKKGTAVDRRPHGPARNS